jgi:hypothetical protein
VEMMEIYLWSGAGLLTVALLASFRMHVLQQRRMARLGDRIAHMTAGLSLLTDTVEGGLRDVAQEIERLAAAKTATTAKPKTRAVTQRRVSTAARRGRSVQDIAAEEKMSESEVRLRLQLAGAAAAREKAHATVR